MWVIQNTILVRLPDDVPLPPHSRVVEVPPDFDPREYRIDAGALTRVERQPREQAEKLTAEEVRQIKAALAADDFGPKRRKEDR
jgi:hypothetical protein